MMSQPDPLHVDFHLLDRQIVDRDGALIGKVDDVELALDGDGVPTVVALLVGQHVLGERVKGLLGRWLSAVDRRLAGSSNPPPLRISWDRVAEVGSEITLAVGHGVLGVSPLETWLRDQVINRIPGARDEG